MKRHQRGNYYVVGEGVLTYDDQRGPVCERPSTQAEARKFRFSRLGDKGEAVLDNDTRKALAEAMTADGNQPDGGIPAGFTYLGQFVDHDLTMDKTGAVLGTRVSVDELLQGRSPALDLDSLYGRGPDVDGIFYSDGVRLKVGRTAATEFPDARTNVDLEGFDLPRRGAFSGAGSKVSERRQALIPDVRNDENLAVAQVHLAFMRFHNRVVDELAGQGVPSADLFNRARELVTRHYQWMLRTDYLPRICEPEIIDDVFTNGRRFFEVAPPPDDRQRALYSYRYVQPGDMPTMPIEFSVAAFRLGHSMVRASYEWNRVFQSGGVPATLLLLFTFSGTSGILSPDGDIANPESGSFERLPTNWIADFRRLFDLTEGGRDDLVAPQGGFNLASRLDTLLVDPLAQLPQGSFADRDDPAPPVEEHNLAFRNLFRAEMVELASGQQMARKLELAELQADEILNGDGGASLAGLPETTRGVSAIDGEASLLTPSEISIATSGAMVNRPLAVAMRALARGLGSRHRLDRKQPSACSSG